LSLQKRLSEALEAIDEALDPTLCGDLSQHGLCKVLWLVTRQKPNLQISRLRCDDYGMLNTRMNKVHKKIMNISQEAQQAMTALKNEMLLTDAFVNALAEAQGFDEEWLVDEVHPKGRGRSAKAVAAAREADLARNQRIPDMMKASAPVQPPPAPPGPVSVPPPVVVPRAAVPAAPPAPKAVGTPGAPGGVGASAKAPPAQPTGFRPIPKAMLRQPVAPPASVLGPLASVAAETAAVSGEVGVENGPTVAELERELENATEFNWMGN